MLDFLTNNPEWTGGSVDHLYRWPSEVFLLQIKQTLRLANFLGHNASAINCQVWTARRVHVLLRFQA